ncbi:hypothetical protein ACIG47_19190 [Promicromonospora sp. NPDC052451]|uniref:hypothetical protein n=1 Tax=Promicromonospora sp. NPDC052451 TaxID=3364407 RepID=UPI0037C5BC6C
MSIDWDEVAKEADLLRGAIITGTLKAQHVEFGTESSRIGDTADQQAAHQRQAGQRALIRSDRSKNTRALDRQLGIASPYPDVHETYCTGEIWAHQLTEAQIRDAASVLEARGWPKDVVARLLPVIART